MAQLEQLAEIDPHVVVIKLSRNFGHQIAITAGLDIARGDAVERFIARQCKYGFFRTGFRVVDGDMHQEGTYPLPEAGRYLPVQSGSVWPLP